MPGKRRKGGALSQHATSADLERDVAEFLARGERITIVPFGVSGTEQARKREAAQRMRHSKRGKPANQFNSRY